MTSEPIRRGDIPVQDVTLYAPRSSSTNAKLIPLSDFGGASETILGKVLPIAAAFADWRNFDIIHDLLSL